MPETPEDKARKTIDHLLDEARWLVQDRDQANVSAGRGVAIRSFPLRPGHGFADYVPFAQHGGVGKAYHVFGKDLLPLLDELNEALAA